MTLIKALLAAAVLVLSVPVVPALAHDDDDNGYSSHDRTRPIVRPARTCPEEGFESGAEHRAYHRFLRDQHDEAHGYGARAIGTYNDYYPRRQYRFYREY